MRGAKPNLDPWTDVRPRLLCTMGQRCRVVLDAEGDVRYEEQQEDALGGLSWVEEENLCDVSDNINLDVEEWLSSVVHPTTVDGVLLSDGNEAVAIEVFDKFYALRGSPGAPVFRRVTRGLAPPNSWVYVADAEDASRVKVSLLYRALGGDPSVTITLCPASP